MSIKIVVEGDSYKGLAEEAWKEERKRLRSKVTKARDMVLNEAKRLLRLRSGPAPAPAGQPPARQTGDLIRSASKTRPRFTRYSVSAGFKFSDPGAYPQEFGGTDKRGIRREAHPYIRPAFEKMTAKVEQLLRSD